MMPRKSWFLPFPGEPSAKLWTLPWMPVKLAKETWKSPYLPGVETFQPKYTHKDRLNLWLALSHWKEQITSSTSLSTKSWCLVRHSLPRYTPVKTTSGEASSDYMTTKIIFLLVLLFTRSQEVQLYLSCHCKLTSYTESKI